MLAVLRRWSDWRITLSWPVSTGRRAVLSRCSSFPDWKWVVSVVDGVDENVPADGVDDQGPEGEASWLGRGVALFTPVFAVAAGWLAGVVAQVVPGAHLDESQVTAFMVAATTAALGAGWKWLQGWQQHERFVAEGKAAPLKSSRQRAALRRK